LFNIFKKKQSGHADDSYNAPEMPPFPEDYASIMRTLAPYHHAGRPLDYFFELFIVSIIDELPQVTFVALEEFSAKHPTFFAATQGNWREFVSQQLKLSDTIEVAIWDLWIRNKQVLSSKGFQYHPWHFAIDFAQNYVAEDSKVDVWEGDSLAQARMRVAEYKRCH
jgi:hypothetical protein